MKRLEKEKTSSMRNLLLRLPVLSMALFLMFGACKKDTGCLPLVTSHINQLGEHHTFLYDEHHRLIYDSADADYTYFYYGDITISNSYDLSDTIQFDSDGRLISSIWRRSNCYCFGRRIMNYLNNNLESITDTSQSGPQFRKNFMGNITYDGTGNIASAIYRTNYADIFTPYYASNVDTMYYFYDRSKFFNDRHNPSVKFHSELSDVFYFPQLFSRNLLIRAEHSSMPSNGKAIEFLSYDYDSKGNLTKVTDSIVSLTSPQNSRVIWYYADYSCK